MKCDSAIFITSELNGKGFARANQHFKQKAVHFIQPVWTGHVRVHPSEGVSQASGVTAGQA